VECGTLVYRAEELAELEDVDDPDGLGMYLHMVSIPAWNPELDEVETLEKVCPIGPEGLVVVV